MIRITDVTPSMINHQYHHMTQDDSDLPFGKLYLESEWVKLAALVPWDVAKDEHATHFVRNGHPAYSLPIALGALITKQRLQAVMSGTARHISENPFPAIFP